MKKEIQNIRFRTKNNRESHFEIFRYEDLLKIKPKDHSQFQNHKIFFYALLLITEGSGKYSINFQDYKFKPRSIFTLGKNTIHKFYRGKAKGSLIIFTEDFISHQLSNVEAADTFMLFNEIIMSPKLQLPESDYNEILLLFKLIKNEHSNFSDTHSNLVIRNLLLAIFSKLLRLKLIANPVLSKNKFFTKFLELQKLVEDNCFTTRLVKFYADKMNTTPKTLNNITQKIIQKSAKTFINDTFLILAKRLIINSSLSLTELSYQVGFDEPTNFFKFFLKHAGMTPKKFKEKSNSSN